MFEESKSLLDQSNLSSPHWRRNQDDSITADEEHGYLPLGRPVDLFVSLLVDFNGRHRLLHIPEHHVQVLIIAL